MEKNLTLRLATVDDARELLDIYAPYVKNTTTTFEYRVPTLNEFKTRMTRIQKKFPFYVAEAGGEVVGYAYASSFRTRSAYAWVAETTVYIKKEHRGYGAGSFLYSALEETLKHQGILTMIACIAYPNPPSMAFHKKMGFQQVGHFKNSGFKNNQWVDIVWMEKQIGVHDGAPEAVIPFPKLG